jgi:uncharacterized protein YdiU (UPF0061 family)
MSDFDWEDDYEEDAPKQSSNALQEARAAFKAQKRQNKELLEQLESLKSGLRERAVKDAIKSKGLPEKVASLIPKDLTTSDEVDAWVADYADVFGVPQPQAAGDQQAEQSNPQFEALQRISNTQAGGQPFTNDEAQMAALIAGASTPEELSKLLFGNAAGPVAS